MVLIQVNSVHLKKPIPAQLTYAADSDIVRISIDTIYTYKLDQISMFKDYTVLRGSTDTTKLFITIRNGLDTKGNPTGEVYLWEYGRHGARLELIFLIDPDWCFRLTKRKQKEKL